MVVTFSGLILVKLRWTDSAQIDGVVVVVEDTSEKSGCHGNPILGVITHMLGFKTFIFHGFGVQGRCVFCCVWMNVGGIVSTKLDV